MIKSMLNKWRDKERKREKCSRVRLRKKIEQKLKENISQIIRVCEQNCLAHFFRHESLLTVTYN